MENYTEKLVGKMITALSIEDSPMGKEFRFRFKPKDPAKILKNLDGTTDLEISSNIFASFMEEQYDKGRVSKNGLFNLFIIGFFAEAKPESVIRLLKYVKENELNAEEYEKSQNEFYYPLHQGFLGMEQSVTSKLLYYMVWKAINGNEKIKNSLLEIYKREFKREYNAMKRFESLDHMDVLHLISNDTYNEIEEVMALSRLLFFAEARGTQLVKPSLFFEVTDRLWKSFKDEKSGFLAVPPLPKDYQLDPEEIEEAKKLTDDDEGIEHIVDVFDSIMANSEIGATFSLVDENDEMVKLKALAPFYTAAMNDMYDEISPLEKKYGLVFAYIVNKAKDHYTEKMKECEQILGMTVIEGEDYLKAIWEPSAKKETPAQASKAKNDLMDEIKHLKERLAEKDAALSKATEKISRLEKDLTLEEREKNRYKKLLEDHATEDSGAICEETTQEPKLEQTVTKEEKIKFLKSKKFCIIGGHQNWTYKIKALFPDWTYLKVKATSAKGDEALLSTERVFFFTDTLSHVSFYRLSNMAKTNNIPCSYLHSVNLDLVIEELYSEAIKEN